MEDEKDDKKYVLTYLLQTHSLNNDPKDWDTKVWMCEFEPDVDNPGMFSIFHFSTQFFGT